MESYLVMANLADAVWRVGLYSSQTELLSGLRNLRARDLGAAFLVVRLYQYVYYHMRMF